MTSPSSQHHDNQVIKAPAELTNRPTATTVAKRATEAQYAEAQLEPIALPPRILHPDHRREPTRSEMIAPEIYCSTRAEPFQPALGQGDAPDHE